MIKKFGFSIWDLRCPDAALYCLLLGRHGNWAKQSTNGAQSSNVNGNSLLEVCRQMKSRFFPFRLLCSGNATKVFWGYIYISIRRNTPPVRGDLPEKLGMLLWPSSSPFPFTDFPISQATGFGGNRLNSINSLSR